MTADVISEFEVELNEQLADLDDARARGRLRGESVAVTRATIRNSRMRELLDRAREGAPDS